MTASQSLKIYELLNEQFKQPEKARAQTEAIEAVVTEKVQSEQRVFESSFKKDFEVLRIEIREMNTAVKGDFRTEMREQKVDLIKWFVSLFVTLALMIIGLYIKR